MREQQVILGMEQTWKAVNGVTNMALTALSQTKELYRMVGMLYKVLEHQGIVSKEKFEEALKKTDEKPLELPGTETKQEVDKENESFPPVSKN